MILNFFNTVRNDKCFQTGAGECILTNTFHCGRNRYTFKLLMRQSKHVRYIRANTLMQEMEHARLISEDMKYMKEIAKLDLLVIDDFGLMDLDIDRCLHLFEVLDTRDGRKSTTVISQFPVSSWFDMFADNTYADACLTRITDKHHTYRLEMNGINMRETDQL